MSYSVDVNVLIYAENTASPLHRPALAFLERCASQSEPFCLAWPTLMSYLRIITNPAIFPSPRSPKAAVENIEALLALPQVRLLSEQDGFFSIYREATKGVAVRGNLVPDAHLAALLRQHGVDTLYTNDRDFRKFDFLRVKNPFA